MNHIPLMFKFIYSIWYRFRPPEMVSWWKEKEAVRAKVTEAKDGSLVMWMEGEKYPFPGYPRGHLLYGSLSPLKHQIKNQIFNDSWAMRETHSHEEIVEHVKSVVLPRIYKLGYESRYDMVPPEKMCPAVKEIHRAWTKVAPQHTELRDILCFILQEDDGYRFRVQWLAPYLRRRNALRALDYGLRMVEHAEFIGDMKERVKLLRTILNILLEDKNISALFREFVKECDWKKVKLSKADKYYFRAKYFKVDYPLYEY